MIDQSLTAEGLCWNWARWCWQGHTVGNMLIYMPDEPEYRPIMIDHARAVERIHQLLPRHEAMVVTAEFPQKNVRFADMDEGARMSAARRWIAAATGVHLSPNEYKLYRGFFVATVGREVGR